MFAARPSFIRRSIPAPPFGHLHEHVLFEAGVNLEVLIFIRPVGFEREGFGHGNDQIGLADAPAIGELRRGRQIFDAPSFAPCSTLALIVAISASVKRGSLAHAPVCGSACQGGIVRLATFSRMDIDDGCSLYASCFSGLCDDRLKIARLNAQSLKADLKFP
jgi:hypothetical protein